jgi:hypothetical protein
MEKVKLFNLQTLKSHLANGVPYEGDLVDPKMLEFAKKHNPSVIFDEDGIRTEMLKMGYKVDSSNKLQEVQTTRHLVIAEVVEEGAQEAPVSVGIQIPDDSEVVSKRGKFRGK